ncbi:hypothetical protein [Armatimonas rosea]|uniref:Uncharacterized protein n=1 Tax=Armatimonas rosea TaxID=685828 RepID=A0A7W9SM42_ARMRO|nr:hypothetical protein [Armatimonas rosea]MBB6048699.1 hypothetical protein [Armatimonas rosea]
MYRGTVIVRALPPMLLVVGLIHWRLFGETPHYDWGDYLLPILGAYVLGRGIAQREKARLCELMAGLGLASIALGAATANPYLVPTSLFLGGAGLFLLPLYSTTLRHSDPECALAVPQTRNTALALVAILCLVSATCGMGWRESILWGAMLSTYICIPALLIALSCTLGGKTRTGASIGAVAALVLTTFLLLLTVLGIRFD